MESTFEIAHTFFHFSAFNKSAICHKVKSGLHNARPLIVTNIRNYRETLYGSYAFDGSYVPSRRSPVRLGTFIFMPGKIKFGSSGRGIFVLFA